MHFYAQLNENKICIGVSQLSGEVQADSMIPIDSISTDYIWRKYENDQWSEEKFEPVSTASLDEFQALKATVDQLVLDALGV